VRGRHFQPARTASDRNAKARRLALPGVGRRKYTWADWQRGGFRGPPPWRRGYQPVYAAISIALFGGLLTIFLLAASGRLP
jgi:hypothetical protein